MDHIRVGSGRGMFAFRCDSTCWWNEICSNIFIRVPSIIVNPVSAGIFFYFGESFSNVGGGIPSIFSWRVSMIL